MESVPDTGDSDLHLLGHVSKRLGSSLVVEITPKVVKR
jgi:hypothetical protein